MSDESTRRWVMDATGPATRPAAGPGRMVELDRSEALTLLASVGYGRLVFTSRALPAVRLVNHLIDDDEIIIRTGATTQITGAVASHRGTVVAYQADLIDPARRAGWSVAVTGIARTVTDPARVARYEVRLRPWTDRVTDTVIGIQTDIVTGYRLIQD